VYHTTISSIYAIVLISYYDIHITYVTSHVTQTTGTSSPRRHGAMSQVMHSTLPRTYTAGDVGAVFCTANSSLPRSRTKSSTGSSTGRLCNCATILSAGKRRVGGCPPYSVPRAWRPGRARMRRVAPNAKARLSPARGTGSNCPLCKGSCRWSAHSSAGTGARQPGTSRAKCSQANSLMPSRPKSRTSSTTTSPSTRVQCTA
jgi:hypothetical protein